MRYIFNIKTLLILLLVFMVGVICLLFPEFFYKFRSTGSVSSAHKTKLINLAAKSLLFEDAPVAALILYNDTVIGEGCNTVMRDSVAYGHAEINALNAAIKKTGPEGFSKLDRNKLVLITTLEPCEMCKGAIVEFRIKHVEFMMDKGLAYWYKENRWRLLYQFHKQQIEGKVLQDSLLNLHPKYNK